MVATKDICQICEDIVQMKSGKFVYHIGKVIHGEWNCMDRISRHGYLFRKTSAELHQRMFSEKRHRVAQALVSQCRIYGQGNGKEGGRGLVAVVFWIGPNTHDC